MSRLLRGFERCLDDRHRSGGWNPDSTHDQARVRSHILRYVNRIVPDHRNHQTRERPDGHQFGHQLVSDSASSLSRRRPAQSCSGSRGACRPADTAPRLSCDLVAADPGGSAAEARSWMRTTGARDNGVGFSSVAGSLARISQGYGGEGVSCRTRWCRVGTCSFGRARSACVSCRDWPSVVSFRRGIRLESILHAKLHRSVRYFDEISVTCEKRDSKCRIGDGCGLVFPVVHAAPAAE